MSLNKVQLIGNLGNDPELKFTPNGNAVANVSVATSSKWKDKNTGAMNEHTEWHRVVFFGKLAEIVNQYLKKGSKIYVEGSLRTNKWQDKDGKDRATTEIVASEMQMLDSRPAGDNYASKPSANYQASKEKIHTPTVTVVENEVSPDQFDDDIPF